jgi:hypothetical protein
MFVAISLLLVLGCVVPASAKLAVHRPSASLPRVRAPRAGNRLISVSELAAGVLRAAVAYALRGRRLRDGGPADCRTDRAPQGAG